MEIIGPKHDTDGHTTLEVPTGIRLGDIRDCAQRLADNHRMCPNARFMDHDEAGNVKVQVIFRARVKLAPDDAVFAQAQVAEQQAGHALQVERQRWRLLQQYCQHEQMCE
jgi:hypothetical protein